MTSIKTLIAGCAFTLLGCVASSACIMPSQVVNSQQWHHAYEPIISKYIQNDHEAFIIAYQRNTSHAIEFKMVNGCWTGVIKVISLASFRHLFGAKSFDEFVDSKDI